MNAQSMTPEEFATTPHGTSVEIADDVHAINAAFWGFPNVVYALRSGERWALIDSGVAETPALAIAPFLERSGGNDSLELVLGTHGHLDHIGGNAILREWSPAVRIALGAADVRWAEDPDLHYRELYEHGAPTEWKPGEGDERVIRGGIGAAARIDHPLVGGEVLTFGGGREIRAVHLGAHSPGQTLYIDSASGIAFSGDAVQGAGVVNADSGLRDFPMYRTRADYLRSLETIRSVRPSILATAHAGLRSADEVDDFLDAAIAWGQRFDDLLLELLRDRGPMDVEQLVLAVGTRWPDYALALQIRVTTGQHLDDLAARGLAEADSAVPPRWSLRFATHPS